MGFLSISRGRPLSQVCNTELDSPIELEWADLEHWRTGSDADGYLVNHHVGGIIAIRIDWGVAMFLGRFPKIDVARRMRFKRHAR